MERSSPRNSRRPPCRQRQAKSHSAAETRAMAPVPLSSPSSRIDTHTAQVAPTRSPQPRTARHNNSIRVRPGVGDERVPPVFGTGPTAVFQIQRMNCSWFPRTLLLGVLRIRNAVASYRALTRTDQPPKELGVAIWLPDIPLFTEDGQEWPWRPTEQGRVLASCKAYRRISR